MRWCITFSEVSHSADMDVFIYVDNVSAAHDLASELTKISACMVPI